MSLSRRVAIAALAASPLLTAALQAELSVKEAAMDAPDPPEIIPLWSAGVPGGEKVTAVEKVEERPPPPGLRDRIVTNPTKPTITVFRPRGRPNGVGVLIAPGGGYIRVVRDKEGYEAARYLAARGYTCFVLLYRLPGDGWAAGSDVALQDAQRAVRLIRSNSSYFGINPDQVGVLGFSAGGHVAASLATRFDDEVAPKADTIDHFPARPDFAGLIYPVIALSGPNAHAGSAAAMTVGGKSAIEVASRVTSRNPTTFMVHAKDDTSVPIANTEMFAAALRAKNVPVEIHTYDTGGHGFGLRTGASAEAWPPRFVGWMRSNRFV